MIGLCNSGLLFVWRIEQAPKNKEKKNLEEEEEEDFHF